MLRALLVALVVANALVFAYTRGWLDGVVAWKSTGDREPERLARQVRPQSIRLLPMSALASAAAAASAAASDATAASAPR